MKKLLLSALTLATAVTLWNCGGGEKKEGSSESTAVNTADFKGKTLNILCWEGYADPKFTKAFEEKYGVTVKGTYFGSSDELIAKLTAGGGDVYDIVTPSPDMAQALVERDLVQPIDLKKVAHYDSLADKLRSMQDVVKNGETYGVPFTWGPDYLVYNADVVKTEPKSWNEFLKPEYKGKIALWDDISSLYLAGMMLGYDKQDKGGLYKMNEQQLAEAKKKLMELKPQVRKYWVTAGELDNLMKNKEVVMAVGWPLTPATLKKEGMNVKGIIPQEGATGWIDRLMITKNTANKDLAMAWIDYITAPENMAKVAEVTNYSVANPGATRFLTPELQEVTQMNNTQYYFDKLNFWQYVKERKRYNEVWNEVKGGAI
ncbi:extracellular solute-binding protein [Fibrisoma montanum]|uniref:Extracellular solute-binding protein n=1 Tax=Fibrisoma montanum TaxID=2305895 RepID=A0A418M078_9BACT|nr:ABC transporter substrate-binding protein [Fibrisoma montanum]RIV19082.1 extracellular solute-binding protein [Fibrisoma montanum]